MINDESYFINLSAIGFNFEFICIDSNFMGHITSYGEAREVIKDGKSYKRLILCSRTWSECEIFLYNIYGLLLMQALIMF